MEGIVCVCLNDGYIVGVQRGFDDLRRDLLRVLDFWGRLTRGQYLCG